MQETPYNDSHYCDSMNKGEEHHKMEIRMPGCWSLSRAGCLDVCSGINALMELREGLPTTNTSCQSGASWLKKLPGRHG